MHFLCLISNKKLLKKVCKCAAHFQQKVTYLMLPIGNMISGTVWKCAKVHKNLSICGKRNRSLFSCGAQKTLGTDVFWIGWWLRRIKETVSRQKSTDFTQTWWWEMRSQTLTKNLSLLKTIHKFSIFLFQKYTHENDVSPTGIV